MGIVATNKGGGQRELIPAGNYLARCIKMIWIGNVTEIVMGKAKILNKVRITWELPTELKVFNEEKGEQPCLIDQEYTLSMHEKANLRIMLKSWRGKDFTEKEAESFEISNLVGKSCMLNIIHVAGKADPTKTYQQIAGVTAIPKGVTCPPQVNPSLVLSYDDWDEKVFEGLPQFIKDKMIGSMEYGAMKAGKKLEADTDAVVHEQHHEEDDLPF